MAVCLRISWAILISRRKVFHTAEEVLEYMFSKEIQSDINALPPDVDELTDEVYFDDDEMTTLSVKGLSGNVEIYVPMEEIEIEKAMLLERDKAKEDDSFENIFRSIFAVTLPLIRSNWWNAQLAIQNDPRYARLESNLGIGQAKEGGSPHTNTIVITAEIESRFIAKDDQIPFRCSSVSSSTAPTKTEASMGGRQGQHT
ncbi:uncharacterized protein TNCV_2992611 [Trichonephila clavipes]|nr:uncharacterized protein TNCV_2992611 [Trichonephila clavipes]